MTLEQIKDELTVMSVEQQDQVAAFLVRLRQLRDPAGPAEIARTMADRDPAHWLTVDQLREHWKD